VLAALGLRPRRALSQSFLTDRARLERIAAAAVPDAAWSAIEIGPGTGALTEPLAARAGRLMAIEADGALAAALAARFAGRPHVRIEHADARRFDFGAPGMPRPLVVAGNIPYHLSGLLLRVVLEADPRPERVVFTVQDEVADRLVAPPGGREYGALTVLCGAGWKPRRLFRIPRGCFHPVPKVDSAAVSFEPREPPACARPLLPRFRAVVIGAFAHRRQTLRNALAHAGYARDAVDGLATVPGVRLDRRPEEHDVAAFVALAAALPGRGG
jgi:16S rRNA (adenine1518-N6/adenine1519-N6)-dimethyltransferase